MDRRQLLSCNVAAYSLALVLPTVALTTLSCSDHQERRRLVVARAPVIGAAVDGGGHDGWSLPTDASSPRPDASSPSAMPVPMQVTEVDIGCPQPLRVSVVHEGAEPSSLVLHEAMLRRASDAYPEREELTRAAAVAAGATDSDDPVWVYTRPDASPCQATPGAFFIEPRAPGGPPYLELVRELHGCPVPPNETVYLALRRHTRSDHCLFRAVRELTTAATTTAVIGRVLPHRACRAPRCELSSRVRSVPFDNGSAAQDIEVVYRFPRRGEARCDTRYDYTHAVAWVPAADGPVIRVDRLGSLTGGFYDSSGMRALVADRLGVVTVFTAPINASQGAEPTQRIVWYLAPEGSSRDGTLEPSCH